MTGITPAYAGNTFVVGYTRCVFWDHPRLRGEHVHYCKKTCHTLGSPPPTRGTPTLAVLLHWCIGITPAYAGNTILQVLRDFHPQDHPRLRGEHPQRSFLPAAYAGSPPPTRGTHNIMEQTHIDKGITPAYAGNTLQITAFGKLAEDHPRLRGEH